MSFLKTAVKSLRSTGAVSASSRWLIDKLLTPVDFSQASVVVEFGMGTGCVTAEILHRLSPGARLYSFEINPEFIAAGARFNDPRLTLLPHSAADLLKYVPPESVDAVVSSLPLATLPGPLKRQILRAAQQALRPGGRFVQFQYSLLDNGLLQDYFQLLHKDFTLLNVPPAVIYVCQKRSFLSGENEAV